MKNSALCLASLLLVFPAATLRSAEQDAASTAPQPASDPLAEAKGLMAQENWKGAASALLKFLRKQPNSPQASEATFWVGYCLVKDGDFEQAIQTLRPFEDPWAEDTWADDALLQLGHAYQGAEEPELALACWKRLVEKYPTSVWLNETLLNIVNLLYWSGNFADCFPYCEQVMKEIADPNSTWEPRYIGAYCLNALHRFDEAEQWVERWFDPRSAQQEAWRGVLAAQRHLLESNAEQAMEIIESLQQDFTDLDSSQWLDVVLRSSLMLRQNNRGDRATTLLVKTLPRLGGHAEDQIVGVLDELKAALGEERHHEFLHELDSLTNSDVAPPTIRVAVRDRYVAELRAVGNATDAADFLRRGLEWEQAEFPRCRAAIMLGEILANDLNDRERAVKLLEDLLASLKRRDYKHSVREKLQEYRTQPGGKP